MTKAFATVFASYNSVNAGTYLPDWPSVVERLEHPVSLEITAEDYQRMKSADAKSALALKFRAGGYDAGECPMVKDPKTGKEAPSRAKGVPRPDEYSMVVLDADEHIGKDFDDKLATVLSDLEYYSHATISSTVEKPRRRILIPLASPIGIDEREAVVRYIANEMGMETIDPASVRPKQLMCFPVHTKDGDTFHTHHKGKFLNAHEWLPQGWKDVANWPKWSHEKDIRKRSKRERKYIDEQGTWLPYPDQNRIHNAYNKTYRASDILKRNGYIQTDETRWSHARHQAQGGIKVTNDAIVFSYYGTDPLSVGRDLDAYEVALILEQGDINDKQSWRKMMATASRDERVRETLKHSAPIDLPENADTWASLWDTTEEGIAQRCWAYFPHRIRNGKWFRYSGGIYTEVKDVAMLPDALNMIRATAILQPDDETVAGMVGKYNIARNVLKCWAGLATQEQDQPAWEEQPWLLHFSDTCVDLLAYCKGEPFLVPHSPSHFLTQSTGYPWADVENCDPKALDELIRNMELYLPDEDVRNYFQRAIGRSLTATAAAEDKCVWMMGPEGGNGKSTILNAIRGALGSYFYELKGSYLYYSNRDRDAEAPSPALAGMRDKRFVNWCEFDAIRTLDGEKYKNYTSAGEVQARKLQSNADTFRAKCVCTVDSNGTPGLKKRENAILRRSRIVPFLAKLNADASIKNRWMTDHRIHVAMMVWMLLGLRDWYANECKLDDGIKTAPHAVYTETSAWFNSFDDPSDFFEDFYEVTNDEADYLIADEAWETYLAQVYDKGASRHAFRQAEERWLRGHGVTKKGKRQINEYGLRRMCWLGVKLIGTYQSQYNTHGKWKHVEVVIDNDKKDEEEPKTVRGGLYGYEY